MITCRKCGKDNQDHYKFCLGCGAELPRETAPKPFSPNTPPHGVAPVKPTDAPAPPVQMPPTGAATIAIAQSPLGAPQGAMGVPIPPAHNSAMPPAMGSVPAPAPMPPQVGAPVPAAAPAPPPPIPGSPTAPPPVMGPSAAVSAVASAPTAVPAVVPAPVTARGAAPAPNQESVVCPQCQHNNPKSNRFCAGCGYNLSALAQMAASPAVVAAPQAPAVSGARPVVLVALRADGTEAGSHALPDASVVQVGRDTGSIFAGDSYLSPKHATFSRRGNDLVVKDAGSLNGVYLKLRPHEPWILEYGDVFRIGQEIIRFEELVQQPPTPDGVRRFGSPSKGYVGRLALVIGRDTTGNAFPIPERGIHCGRERGDVLFSEDGYVSGLHCRIVKGNDGLVTITDVGSSNGTFVRLKAEHILRSGEILLMGQQLFRVDF